MHELKVVPWSIMDIFDDIDDKVNVYNLLLKDVVDHCAPLVKKKPCKAIAPWISNDLRRKMAHRNRLYRKFLKSRLPCDLISYRKFRNHVVYLQRKAKSLYLMKLVNSCASASSIWSALKVFQNNGNITKSCSSSLPSASALNSHFAQVCREIPLPSFSSTLDSQSLDQTSIVLDIPQLSSQECASIIIRLKSNHSVGHDLISPVILKSAPSQLSIPLSSIINDSISEKYFPSQWKSAIVHPLHKSGPLDVCSNYRPISILPAASKVAEIYLADLLKSHLEENNLLYPLQSGFRQGHSTQPLLLYLCDSRYKSLDNGKYVGVVFLDISKAFDTVNHELLLCKLQSQFFLSSSLCCLLQSYLNHRCQSVLANGHHSNFAELSSGVPQGSILGPILFSMFINDLPAAVHSSVDTALFADDSTFYASGSDPSIIERNLNSALVSIQSWMKRNGLIVNELRLNVCNSF
jgi:hypothetical protein